MYYGNNISTFDFFQVNSGIPKAYALDANPPVIPRFQFELRYTDNDTFYGVGNVYTEKTTADVGDIYKDRRLPLDVFYYLISEYKEAYEPNVYYFVFIFYHLLHKLEKFYNNNILFSL